jgi:hypothetical protein
MISSGQQGPDQKKEYGSLGVFLPSAMMAKRQQHQISRGSHCDGYRADKNVFDEQISYLSSRPKFVLVLARAERTKRTSTQHTPKLCVLVLPGYHCCLLLLG